MNVPTAMHQYWNRVSQANCFATSASKRILLVRAILGGLRKHWIDRLCTGGYAVVLAKHPKARRGFEEMPPGHRRSS